MISPIALLLLLSFATQAFGQSASHSMSLSTPSYVGIRIVGTGAGPRSVMFDYSANPTAYLSIVDAGGGALPPTSVSRFDDVQLSISRNGRWHVHVQAAAFTYVGPATPTGLALNDVRVTRTGPQDAVTGPGGSASYVASWRLSDTATEIASSNRSTGGWRSLGISGWDYSLDVDGNEAPGTYATVVAYSLTAP